MGDIKSSDKDALFNEVNSYTTIISKLVCNSFKFEAEMINERFDNGMTMKELEHKVSELKAIILADQVYKKLKYSDSEDQNGLEKYFLSEQDYNMGIENDKNYDISLFISRNWYNVKEYPQIIDLLVGLKQFPAYIVVDENFKQYLCSLPKTQELQNKLLHIIGPRDEYHI